VWTADYVLMEYGTGAIMAVPGHDERDFEFARKFDLPVVRVVAAEGEARTRRSTRRAHARRGRPPRQLGAVRRDDGARGEARRGRVAGGARRGAAVTNYRLHDWCISRQRYWGPPIPIVYCDACGTVPVPEDQLPVELPFIEDFKPDDSGVSPLARHAEWYHVPCPACGGPGAARDRRQRHLPRQRLVLPALPERAPRRRGVRPALTARWLPVSSYIGGNEHAVLHLLYSRFVTMVLHDAGLVPFEEPFAKFRAHGLIVREGAKMSKSKGNVINPDDAIERWGADTFRTYLMFLGPYEEAATTATPASAACAASSTGCTRACAT
jgi:leucyl-tRNA synthetase